MSVFPYNVNVVMQYITDTVENSIAVSMVSKCIYYAVFIYDDLLHTVSILRLYLYRTFNFHRHT